MEPKQWASEESKRTVSVLNKEDEYKLMEYPTDNELLYNKRLMDYKDRHKNETVWDKLCTENKMDKAICKRWFQSQRTIYDKIIHMKVWTGSTSSHR